MMMTLGAIGIGTCKGDLEKFKLGAFVAYVHVVLSYPSILGTLHAYDSITFPYVSKGGKPYDIWHDCPSYLRIKAGDLFANYPEQVGGRIFSCFVSWLLWRAGSDDKCSRTLPVLVCSRALSDGDAVPDGARVPHGPDGAVRGAAPGGRLLPLHPLGEQVRCPITLAGRLRWRHVATGLRTLLTLTTFRVQEAEPLSSPRPDCACQGPACPAHAASG